LLAVTWVLADNCPRQSAVLSPLTTGMTPDAATADSPHDVQPTVGSILAKTTGYLQTVGIDNAAVDAAWLVAHVLGCKRLDLFLQHERPLTEQQLAPLRVAVRRRAKREPLQYILGTVPFHQAQLAVRPGVLIPLPETEDLVDRLVRLAVDTPPTHIADLGTGSGAIAIALARALPTVRVFAVDCSEEALAVARANCAANGVADRVTVLAGSWYTPLPHPVDWVVSNPPYLTDEEWATAAPEVRQFEPRGALVAGDRGLADLQAIIRGACDWLKPGGLLACETGIAQHPALMELATGCGLVDVESVRDIHRRPRFLLARRR
jgi:release factor glutamine methyltransferase